MRVIRQSILVVGLVGAFLSTVLPQVSSSNEPIKSSVEVERVRKLVDQLLANSGFAFKEGIDAYIRNDRALAAQSFNRSIEVFLNSTVNLEREQKLRGCYNQLIETIYRIEFPFKADYPNISTLANICGWNLSEEVAQKVAALSRKTANGRFDISESAANSLIERRDTLRHNLDNARNRLDQAKAKQIEIVSRFSNNSNPELDAANLKYDKALADYLDARTAYFALSFPMPSEKEPLGLGFNQQTYEPSPLDELSKLELTPEEQRIELVPVSAQQYQYIQTAIANRSLGFFFRIDPLIQQYINYYRGRGRSPMEVGLYRSGAFMRTARRIFKEEGVPENVAWIAQVYSNWQPNWPEGMWNFGVDTAKTYGLRITTQVDERRSIDEATRAAARRIKALYSRYSDWELTLAAYEVGTSIVDNAIAKAGARDYWKTRKFLPKTAQNFVPSSLAHILIANNPVQYGFGSIRPAPPLIYERIRVPGSTNLRSIAEASNTSVQYLRFLNPQLKTDLTPAEPYVLNIPAGTASDVVAFFRRKGSIEIFSTDETWQTIANRMGVNVTDLMAANPGMNEPKGKVFVPISGNNVDTVTYSRPTSSQSTAVPGVRVVKAKAGETVQKVAERYNADPIVVAKYNGLLPNSILGAGREIKIPQR